MTPSPASRSPRIAVAIPCYNEAAAVASVISEWRSALPDAEVFVFDNNSNDGTGDIARGLGIPVVDVPEQGKGHAVRAIFRDLGGRDAVILIDGDGTYPASDVGPLLEAVLDGKADTAIGARRPVAEPGAMSPVRGLGNVLIRSAFRVLIGPGAGDLLSGYRVFGPRFLREVSPRSRGFEIETELTAAAIAQGLRVVEHPVAYRPRIPGAESKLRAFRDGRRILLTILAESLRLRPWRPLGLALGFAIVISAAALAFQAA